MELKRAIAIGILLFAAASPIIDLVTDGLLAADYLKCKHYNYGGLTIGWVALGATAHFIVVAISMYTGNSKLKPFPTWLQVIILVSSPFLLAPTVVNIFAVYLFLQIKECCPCSEADLNK